MRYAEAQSLPQEMEERFKEVVTLADLSLNPEPITRPKRAAERHHYSTKARYRRARTKPLELSLKLKKLLDEPGLSRQDWKKVVRIKTRIEGRDEKFNLKAPEGQKKQLNNDRNTVKRLYSEHHS